MKKNKNALIVFAKAPVAGTAKTRLIPRLGAQGAAELHQKLVLHTLNNLVNPQHWDTILWCAGDRQHDFFQHCLASFDLVLDFQQGENLGDRMFHAIASSLSVYSSVCLVGTDCPVLTRCTIIEAFESLEASDMVFNPAEDGGYVLLAAKLIDRRVFENIRWGTGEVMQKSLENVKKTGYQVSLLSTLWDVDVPDDLFRLEMLNPDIA